MTAKQKANRERFKKVVAEAKKLRKKNPKLTQPQAVKQAWAIMYGKGKKVAGYSKERTTIHKRATKWAKNIKGKNPDLDKKSVLARAYEHAGYGPLQKVGAVKKKDVKKKATKKKAAPKKSTSYHKDTKSHNVNIRVISGVKRKAVGALPKYTDQDAAREIELYADNDSQLYFQMKRPILINLGKKYKKGTFDVNKAAKLWRYFIDAALKKYHKEFGSKGDKWFDLLNTHDRQLLAMEYAVNTKAEFDLGNFIE